MSDLGRASWGILSVFQFVANGLTVSKRLNLGVSYDMEWPFLQSNGGTDYRNSRYERGEENS